MSSFCFTFSKLNLHPRKNVLNRPSSKKSQKKNRSRWVDANSQIVHRTTNPYLSADVAASPTTRGSQRRPLWSCRHLARATPRESWRTYHHLAERETSDVYASGTWKEKHKERLRSVEIAERKELYNSLLHNRLYVLLVNQGKRVRRPAFSCFSSVRSFPAEIILLRKCQLKFGLAIQSYRRYSTVILWH